MNIESILGKKEDVKEILGELGLKEGKSPQKIREKQNSKGGGIVYAQGDNIYILMPFAQDIALVEGDKEFRVDYKSVDGLYFHNGTLYHAIEKMVYNTLENKVVAEMENKVYSLCSHNGKLCGRIGYNKIIEIFTEKEMAKVRSPTGLSLGMCSYEGELYYIKFNKIYNVSSNKIVAKRKDNILGLLLYKGRLCDLSRQTMAYALYDTLTGKILVDELLWHINTPLCSHNGRIYCADKNNDEWYIIEPLTKKKFGTMRSYYPISAICSVDENFVQRALKEKGETQNEED